MQAAIGILDWLRNEPVTAIGIGGAVASLLRTAISVWTDYREERRKLKAMDEEFFLEAIRSESLAMLGGYLDTRIGKFLVDEYTDSDLVRDRVNAYLARIENYVGTSVKAEPVFQLGGLPRPRYSRKEELSDVDKIRASLSQDEVWNALARLRRLIEQQLVKIAMRNNVRLPDRAGATQMIRLLTKVDVLDGGTGQRLAFTIGVANRAIHGEEVPREMVEDAVSTGLMALSAMGYDDSQAN